MIGERNGSLSQCRASILRALSSDWQQVLEQHSVVEFNWRDRQKHWDGRTATTARRRQSLLERSASAAVID